MFPRKNRLHEDQLMSPQEYLAAEHRTVFLAGEVGGYARCPIPDLLMALDAQSHEPIKLIIASPGGSIADLFILHDTMNLIESPVWTIGQYCASAATVLLASGEPNFRFVLPYARTMLHLASGGIQGADTKQWEIYNRELQRAQNVIIDILQAHGVKKPREEILADIDREFWLSAQETVRYGLADAVLTPEIYRGWMK